MEASTRDDITGRLDIAVEEGRGWRSRSRRMIKRLGRCGSTTDSSISRTLPEVALHVAMPVSSAGLGHGGGHQLPGMLFDYGGTTYDAISVETDRESEERHGLSS